MTFDPYYTWLGIPPADQPPNHYRLLAIERFESNVDVISNAADRLMTFVHSLGNGPNAGEAQRLLNEVSAVRLCLLDVQQKKQYDKTLQASSQPQAVEPPPVAVKPPAGSPVPTSQTRRFGDYELLATISDGASGTIYQARHAGGQLVALKVLSAAVTQSPERFARFQRKVSILTKLGHGNLVRAYLSGQHEGRVFLATEFVDGRNLADWLKQVGPLPLQHAIHYLIQAATGLGYAHQNGVIHRNIKPRNLLVDNQTGVIKVVGMGLARLAEYAHMNNEVGFRTEPGRGAMGTLNYMAPEQIIDSSTADARSDIYSLGCTLFHLLSGHVPYPEKGMMKKALAHRKSPIPSLQAARPEAPSQLEPIFQKMLAKQASDRYSTMEEVAAALSSV